MGANGYLCICGEIPFKQMYKPTAKQMGLNIFGKIFRKVRIPSGGYPHPLEPAKKAVGRIARGPAVEFVRRKRKDLWISVVFLGLAALLVMASWDSWIWFKTTPPYVDPERYPIRGIDISAHNGMMNLDAAYNDGIRFCYIKASEGAGFRDRNFRLNYSKARHAGMKIGAYHYFRFDTGGVEQARNLIEAVGYRKLDLGIAVDVEETGNATGVPSDSILDRLARMAEYLNLRGYRVVFYSNRSGVYDYLDHAVPGCPLWVCSFSKTPIERDWLFWQYDHHGKVAGISGDVDLNTFYGNEEEWEAFLKEQQYPAR